MKITLLFLCLLLPLCLQAQTINTYAGNGVATYAGDGGLATAASLSRPIFCFRDNSGNLLISDYNNNRIRKVNAVTGIITTIAGTGIAGFSGDGGPATAAEINGPTKVIVDGSGNIYLCDFLNQRIRKINTAGIITTIAGTGAIGYTGDGGPATAATMWYPGDMAIDPAGNIYFSDEWNNRIRKINTAGTITTIAGDGSLGYLSGGYGGDGGPALSAQINFPVGIVVNTAGDVIFSDDGNARVREISPSGIINTIAGDGTPGSLGDGGPATAAQLHNPEGIAIDLAGDLYICEAGGARVRKVNTAGTISTFAGTGTAGYSGDGGPATSAEIDFPEGIFVDTNSSCVFICDATNNRVRIVGTCTVATSTSCFTNSLIINTGYNPVTAAAITPVPNLATPTTINTDLHWQVTAMSAATYAGIAAAGGTPVVLGASADVVTTYTGGWAVYSGLPGQVGNWINCLNANYYVTDPTTYGPDVYTETFTRPFHLCSSDTVAININIANDNYCKGISIDGAAPYYFQPSPGIPGCVTSFLSAPTTLYLSAGWHTINVEVVNYNNVYGVNYGGLAIWGTVASTTGTNSIVAETDTTCGASCTAVSTLCNTLSMPDSLRLCLGDTATINAIVTGTDTIQSIAWSPNTGLSDTTVLNPVLTATASGWYVLTVGSISGTNLVVNGDFSASYAGFTTDYIIEGYGITSTPGYYAVDVNPYPYDAAWPAMGDHTTGTGNMLIVDGAYSSTQSFWCETMAVTPNTNYIFTLWTALFHDPLPILQISINGSVYSSFTLSSSVGTWQQYQIIWNSGTATSASICMSDLDLSGFGNDFGVDDISFRQICVATDSVYLSIGTTDTTITHTDTSFCNLAPGITLTAPTSYTAYIWSTGATTPSVTVTSGGIYRVQDVSGCSLLIDSIHVFTSVADVGSATIDTAICAGNSVALYAPTGYPIHFWNNGDTTESITANTAGQYWAAGENLVACDMTVDTFNVTINPLPYFTLPIGSTFCPGDSVQLFASNATGTYIWNTGSTADTITVSQAGTYALTITNNGCQTTDSVQVTELAPPAPLSLGPDTVLCSGDAYELITNNESTVWNNHITAPTLNVTDSGVYWATVSNKCGSVTDSVTVSFDPCDLYFPNAFTPNNDGRNDIARAIGYLSRYRNYKLSIYNRFGQRIFYTEDIYAGWDGTFNGVTQNIDTYFYMITYSLEGKNGMLKGDLTLIR